MEKGRLLDRSTAKWAIGSTFLFGLAAHAFRYFSMGVSHDSLCIVQDEATWQISLGRFLQPVYLLLRGNLCAPMLIGLFSLVWLSLAALLVVSVTGMKNRFAIVLACGVLATNATLTLSNATYISWSDIFMLSLLLAVLAVFICRKYRLGYLFGAIPLCASLALYQSYIEVSAMLLLILLVQDCFHGLSPKAVVLRGIKALGMLALGLAVYNLCMHLSLRLTGVELSTTYNGISGIGDYSGYSVWALLWETYVGPVKTLLHLSTFHPVLSTYLSAAIFLAAAAGIVRVIIVRKLPVCSVVLTGVFLLLMPFAINFVYFLSKGFKHALMMYAFYFIYVFAIVILDENFADASIRPHARRPGRRSPVSLAGSFVVLATALFVLNNIVYANQVYMKKEVEYEATLFTITRIVDRIEQTDGYVANETRVVIVGDLNSSELSVERPGFEGLEGLEALGTGNNYAVTYIGTYEALFTSVLGYPIDLVTDEDLIDAFAGLEQVRSMPAFPSTGCCSFVDGVLVVKLS